jgi:hypothetical protein
MAKSSRVQSKSPGLGPIFLVGGGVTIILIVIIWQLSSAAGSAAIPQNSQLPSVATPQNEALQTPFPEISRVSPEDAKAAFDSQSAVFVDVRDSGSYASGHISGAINIPLTDLESRANELPKDRWIITYCT